RQFFKPTAAAGQLWTSVVIPNVDVAASDVDVRLKYLILKTTVNACLTGIEHRRHRAAAVNCIELRKRITACVLRVVRRAILVCPDVANNGPWSEEKASFTVPGTVSV